MQKVRKDKEVIKKSGIATVWAVPLFIPFHFPSPFSAYSLLNQQIPVLGQSDMSGTIYGKTTVSIFLHTVVWGVGVIVCTLFFAVSYFKCRREFRESMTVKNDFLIGWIAEHKLT